MSAPRAHRAARDPQAVLDQIADGRGTQFDPKLVDLVLAHRDTVAAALREGCPHTADAAAA
jgi:HD-GYP domain-containing protein (c-di-GMP phosphodiesterase class II)